MCCLLLFLFVVVVCCWCLLLLSVARCALRVRSCLLADLCFLCVGFCMSFVAGLLFAVLACIVVAC